MSREPKTPKPRCPKCGAVLVATRKLKNGVYRRVKTPKGYNYNGCKCAIPSWSEWWAQIMGRYRERPTVEPYQGLNRHDDPETTEEKRRRKALEHKVHQNKDKR
jgi:hypothetical protein